MSFHIYSDTCRCPNGGRQGKIFKIDTSTLLQMAFLGLIKASKYSIFLRKLCHFRKKMNKQNCFIKNLLWCSHSLHYKHIIYNDNEKQLERFLELNHWPFALIETLKSSLLKNCLHTCLILRMPILLAQIMEIVLSLISLTSVRFFTLFS